MCSWFTLVYATTRVKKKNLKKSKFGRESYSIEKRNKEKLLSWTSFSYRWLLGVRMPSVTRTDHFQMCGLPFWTLSARFRKTKREGGGREREKCWERREEKRKQAFKKLFIHIPTTNEIIKESIICYFIFLIRKTSYLPASFWFWKVNPSTDISRPRNSQNISSLLGKTRNSFLIVTMETPTASIERKKWLKQNRNTVQPPLPLKLRKLCSSINTHQIVFITSLLL